MNIAHIEIDLLARKGWSSEKAKDILLRDLPIGSTRIAAISYIESRIEMPYLEFSISNPQSDQIIPAGTLLSNDVVNHTCADKVITCGTSYPKLGKYKVTGYIAFAFWFRDDKLTLINVANMGRIV